ncbi:UDP-glucose 4-epimerase [Clostridia bacterium]|nr:UDP-glucose 4-epimerase [Clostridia bacterium]
MKQILITGINSYIGNNIRQYLNVDPSFHVESISVRSREWIQSDFSKYDTVIDVAGIAHVKPLKQHESLFYQVNRDLAIEICRKAKVERVKQFIYLSSMNVFGDTTEMITTDTIPKPKNFYGNSKLEADNAIQAMNCSEFHTTCVRPPVIYGVGCKGNFRLLEMIAKHTLIFPDYPNQRSVLYIDNLVEFIKRIIQNNDSGIFYPQNREYVSTSEMVAVIAEVHKHKLLLTKRYNSIIQYLVDHTNRVERVFGDDRYDMSMSNYENFSYCKSSFYESIVRMAQQSIGMEYKKGMKLAS